MTPKQDAEKLVSKFFLSNYGYGPQEREKAKKNATIAVDEIIRVLNPEHWGLEMNIAVEELNHWREVKQEIEKI